MFIFSTSHSALHPASVIGVVILKDFMVSFTFNASQRAIQPTDEMFARFVEKCVIVLFVFKDSLSVMQSLSVIWLIGGLNLSVVRSYWVIMIWNSE